MKESSLSRQKINNSIKVNITLLRIYSRDLSRECKPQIYGHFKQQQQLAHLSYLVLSLASTGINKQAFKVILPVISDLKFQGHHDEYRNEWDTQY